MAGERIKSFLVEKIPALEKIIGPAKKAEFSISEELVEPWQKEMIEKRYGVKLDKTTTWGGVINELTRPVPGGKNVHSWRIPMTEIEEALFENVDMLSPESRDAFEKDPQGFVDNIFFRDIDEDLGWDLKKCLVAAPAIAAALFVVGGTYDYLKDRDKRDNASEVIAEEEELTPYRELLQNIGRGFGSGRYVVESETLVARVKEYQGSFPNLHVFNIIVKDFFGKKHENPDIDFLEQILLRTEPANSEGSYYIEEQRYVGDSLVKLDYLASNKLKGEDDLIKKIRRVQEKLVGHLPVVSDADFAVALFSGLGKVPENLLVEVYRKMTPDIRLIADVVRVNRERMVDNQALVRRLKLAKKEGLLLGTDHIIYKLLRSIPPDTKGNIDARREVIMAFVDIISPKLNHKLASFLLGYSRGLDDVQNEIIGKSINAGWQIDRLDLVVEHFVYVGRNEPLQKKLIDVTKIRDDEDSPSLATLERLRGVMHPNLFTKFIEEKLSPGWKLLLQFEEAKTEDEKIAILERIIKITKKKIARHSVFGGVPEAFLVTENKRQLFASALNMPRLQEILLRVLPEKEVSDLARDETYKLDRLEDRGEHKEVRKAAESYTAPFLYAMIAQGQELNNISVFEVLYGNLKEKLSRYGGLERFLAEVDPRDNFASKFVLTLSFFGKLGELVTNEKGAELWGEKIIAFLRSKKAGTNSIFLTPTLENIFSGSAPRLKEYLEDKFLRLAKSMPMGSKERQLFELILAQYGDRFSDTKRSEAVQLSAGARESFEKYFSIPVKEWVDERGVFQSHMFFHPDHAYHFAHLIEAAEVEGYKVAGRTVKDKKDVEIVLERPTKGYPAKTLRIVATMSGEPKVAETIEFGKTPIVGHRGHAYQLDQTFYQKASLTKPTLFFFGSCGGFRAIPAIAEKYGSKVVFIATLGVGRGEVNTQLLLHLMRAVGEQGITRWDRFVSGLNPSLKKDAREYVFPHQLPVLKLFEKG